MVKIDFSAIASKYENSAAIQKSASEILLELLKIGNSDDVLDLGCGTGYITRKIRKLTRGKVVGIDPSHGMIEEAIKKSVGLNIIYEVRSAEDMEYREEFDVIFCNSVMQWFKDPVKAIQNCYRALKRGGRIGVQAPATSKFCPNFIKAIEMVKKDYRTRKIFSRFRKPWFFLETAEEYKALFEKCGFKVTFSKIITITTEHTPEDVYRIFSSAAVAGFLNQDYYDVELTDEYVTAFKEIVKKAFEEQRDENGLVKLKFNRVFLVGTKDELIKRELDHYRITISSPLLQGNLAAKLKRKGIRNA